MVARLGAELWIAGLALAGASGNAFGQEFQLIPGATIAQDSSGALTGEFELVQYSPNGVELSSLSLASPPPFFGVMVGVTVIDGEVWTLGNGAGTVARIDLQDGTFAESFNTFVGGAESLTHIEGDLLIGYYSGRVERRKTNGQLVSSIETTIPLTGLATDGTSIYCASYQSGFIHRFDQQGTALNVIPTSVGGYSLSGLAYDEVRSELVLSSGFGLDELHRYKLNGIFVDTFEAGWSYVNDLDTIPSACVDAFVPAIQGGTTLMIAGDAPPGQPVALGIALSTGTATAFAAGGFCGESSLDPMFGLVQLFTTSASDGTWSILADVPAGFSLPVYLQAFVGGTCPTSCSSEVFARVIE